MTIVDRGVEPHQGEKKLFNVIKYSDGSKVKRVYNKRGIHVDSIPVENCKFINQIKQKGQ